MSTGSTTVTPGKQFDVVNGEVVDLSKLNQLGSPLVRVDADSIGRRELQAVIREQIDGATAEIGEEITIRVSETSALAERATWLEAAINTPTTGMLARIETVETTTATNFAAIASFVASLMVTFGDQGATITHLQTVFADADTAMAQDISTLEAAINTPATGIIARVTAAETAIASKASNGDLTAVANRTTTLETAINTPTTGLTARVTTVETTKASTADMTAMAQFASMLLATRDDLGASVQVLSSAFVDAAGRAVSTYGWKLDANGKIVSLQAIAASGGAQAEIGTVIFGGCDVQSDTFVAGSSGWRWRPSGDVEVNSGVFRGTLSAATGTFAGALVGATGTFSGALNAATGTFAGTVTIGSGLNQVSIQSGEIRQGLISLVASAMSSTSLLKAEGTSGLIQLVAPSNPLPATLEGWVSGIQKFSLSADGWLWVATAVKAPVYKDVSGNQVVGARQALSPVAVNAFTPSGTYSTDMYAIYNAIESCKAAANGLRTIISTHGLAA